MKAVSISLNFSILILLFSLFFNSMFAQNQGENDATFNTHDNGYYGTGMGVGNGNVVAIETYPNGKVIVGGNISQVNSVTRQGIAVINPDFSLDLSFNPGSGIQGGTFTNRVRVIKLLSDGRFYVGGDYQSYNNDNTKNHLSRVYPNGAIDVTFGASSSGFNGVVHDLEIQPDSNLLVAGIFSDYDGHYRKGICRLLPSGLIDQSFDTGPIGFVGAPRCIALQDDGKIIAGGNFSAYGTINRRNILRLNSDGSLDTSFHSGIDGFNNIVHTVEIQPDGKVLVGGEFTNYNGTPINGIARLNLDGSLDSSFDVGTGTGLNSIVYDIKIQSDGKILLGGSIPGVDGYDSPGLVRLNVDGSVDSTFVTNASSLVTSVNVLADEKIMIGGWFLDVNSHLRGKVARLHSNGSVDSTFNSGTGFNSRVNSLILQDDLKIIAAGSFRGFNGKRRWGIARMHPEGEIDYSFNTDVGFNSEVLKIVMQPDKKVIAGGHFVAYDDAPCSKIARLNPDGTIDNSFDIGSGFDDFVSDVALQQDGKIIVVGKFSTYNGISGINQIVRLNSDGSIDNTFSPPPIPLQYSNNYIASVGIQPNGKIVIGGQFQQFNGDSSLKYFVRLNSDGSIDPSLNYSSGFNGSVSSIHPEEDGKILLGGEFTSYNGDVCRYVTRLLENGDRDESFQLEGIGFNGTVTKVKYGSDDKIYVGGWFTHYNGNLIRGLARLKNDGTQDNTYNPGESFVYTLSSTTVLDFVEQPDEKIVVGGNFIKFDDIWRNRIARIYSGPCHSSNYIIDTVCESKTLNDFVYDKTGIYKQVIKNHNDCDSIITLELYIDNNSPVPDLENLPIITEQCSATITTQPTATDFCDGQIFAITDDDLSYDTPGSYTIEWKYIDADSNITIQNQIINIADTIPPVPDLDSIPTITSACNYEINSPPTASDNCDGTVTGFTNDATSFIETGTYTVLWTFTDNQGNTSSQTQEVNIIDTIAPVPDLDSLPEITEVCSFTVIDMPTATDECDGLIYGETDDEISFSNSGNYTITWTYEDANGNTSSQVQSVTLNDTVSPTIDSCPNSIEGCENSPVTWSPPTAQDNCEIASFTSNYNSGDIFSVGLHEIEYIATDINGNTAYCNFELTVFELTDVTLLIPDTIYLEETTSLELISSPSGGTFSGFDVFNNHFEPSTVGVFTIFHEYSDSNGCVTNSSHNITVLSNVSTINTDHAKPVIKVFPNPTNTELNVSIYDHFNDDVSIEIYTLDGKLVFSSSQDILENSEIIKLDVSNLSRAVYVLKLFDNSSIHIGRFSKI